MYEWKTPVTREKYLQLTNHSRVAALRGKYKAKDRYIKLIKRHTLYRNRAEDNYQLRLANAIVKGLERPLQ